MRLIDADKLIEVFAEKKEVWRGNGVLPSNESLMWLAAMDITANAPTADAVPVKHSRWIEPVPGDGFPYCGNCKAPALDKGLFLNPKLMDWHKTKYCPNCGAKMDLEEDQ